MAFTLTSTHLVLIQRQFAASGWMEQPKWNELFNLVTLYGSEDTASALVWKQSVAVECYHSGEQKVAKNYLHNILPKPNNSTEKLSKREHSFIPNPSLY